LLLGYIFIGLICIFFTLHAEPVLFVGGIFLFMFVAPLVEAGEQTIIQTVVPQSKQGRVFGFAQTVEAGVMPVSIFIIGPLAQSWAIPYMKSKAGQQTLGWLLGTGETSGLALTFVIAGAFMLLLSLLAFRTKDYHILSTTYRRNMVKEE